MNGNRGAFSALIDEMGVFITFVDLGRARRNGAESITNGGGGDFRSILARAALMKVSLDLCNSL